VSSILSAAERAKECAQTVEKAKECEQTLSARKKVDTSKVWSNANQLEDMIEHQ